MLASLVAHSGRAVYYALIAAGGCFAGLVACIVAGMSMKWILVCSVALTLILLFVLTRNRRRLSIVLFVFSAPFFIAKRIFSSDYPLITGGPSSLGIFLYDIPLVILLVYLIRSRVLRRDSSLHIPPIFMPLMLYTLWSLISIYNASEPVLTLIEIFWFCKLAVILLVMVNIVEDWNDLVLVLATLIAGLFFQEIVTFLQSHLQLWFSLAGDVEQTTLKTSSNPDLFRAGGTLGPHNVQAAYYVIMIPLTASLFFCFESNRIKFILFLVTVIGCYALALTFSRNGYLSLVAAFTAVFLLAWYKKIVERRWLVLSSSVAVIIVLLLLLSKGGAIVERIRSSAAIEPRMEGVKIAFNMIREHSVAGVGLNNFAIAMRDRVYSPTGVSSLQQTYFGGEYFGTVVHNKYLLVASETGVIGLILFLWILLKAGSAAFKLLDSREKRYVCIGIGMIAVLVGASIQMSFDIYNSDLLMTIFWIIMGVLFASLRLSQAEQGKLPLDANS